MSPRHFQRPRLPPPPTDLERARTALFLDFDGTLAAIVDDPAAVRVEPAVVALIGTLRDRLDGALAVVSGRPVGDLDRFLAPLALPAAGIHGIERRDAAGRFHSAPADAALVEALHGRARDFAAARPGILVERKAASVAIHYRRRPDLAETVAAFAAGLVAANGGPRLIAGKMVFELAAGHRTKGDAIAAFLDERPFAGRMPVFAGDDVTDEDGFRVVAERGGVAVKVGDGPTAAGFRLAGPAALTGWLADVAAGWRA